MEHLIKKTNELTIYGILCQNFRIFNRQELAFLFQVQEKLKACKNSKLDFLSSCFIADDRHVKFVWLREVVLSEHDNLHFGENMHLFKHYPVKITQNSFISSTYLNQTCVQVSQLSCALDK